MRKGVKNDVLIICGKVCLTLWLYKNTKFIQNYCCFLVLLFAFGKQNQHKLYKSVYYDVKQYILNFFT